MGHKGLAKRGVSHAVRIRLEEPEEKILRLIAERGGGIAGLPAKPTYPQVVVAVLRLGLVCLRDHGEVRYAPEPISEQEAIQVGLHWPGKDKRKPVINSRPVNLYKPERKR